MDYVTIETVEEIPTIPTIPRDSTENKGKDLDLRSTLYETPAKRSMKRRDFGSANLY